MLRWAPRVTNTQTERRPSEFYGANAYHTCIARAKVSSAIPKVSGMLGLWNVWLVRFLAPESHSASRGRNLPQPLRWRLARKTLGGSRTSNFLKKPNCRVVVETCPQKYFRGLPQNHIWGSQWKVGLCTRRNYESFQRRHGSLRIANRRTTCPVVLKTDSSWHGGRQWWISTSSRGLHISYPQSARVGAKGPGYVAPSITSDISNSNAQSDTWWPRRDWRWAWLYHNATILRWSGGSRTMETLPADALNCWRRPGKSWWKICFRVPK